MKLLSKTEAQSSLRKDNDELVETNIRLRSFWVDINKKLNTARENYDADKIAALKDFEAYVKDINAKKSTLLKELSDIEANIKQRKELYYALITKQDHLEERIYQANEKEAKLTLREKFVTDLEQKWRAKQ